MTLTQMERKRLAGLAALVDLDRVRIHRHGMLRRLVLGLSRGRAIALGNRIFLPDRCAGDTAVLAHELAHAGQYQRWGALTYYARGLREQTQDLLHRAFGICRSPYRYRLEPGRPLETYGMEQQGQIVEDAFRGDAAARCVCGLDSPTV